jgi:uroporphyrinogen-III synthase
MTAVDSPGQPHPAPRILVTRPRPPAHSPPDPLVTALAEIGAHVIWLPTIRIAPADDPAPLDAAVQRALAGSYAWIVFTSANAVDPVTDRLPDPPTGTRIAAVGPATAAVLVARGWRVDRIPQLHTAEALVGILDDVAGRRILFPKADIARPTIETGLTERGASVDAVIAYRTLPAEPDPAALAEVRRGVDVAVFTSGSAVRAFAAMVGRQPADGLRRARVACIGPETARAAVDVGLTVDIVPTEHTIPGLIAAIAADLAMTRAEPH